MEAFGNEEEGFLCWIILPWALMPQWQFKVWTMTLNKTWHGWSEKWCFVIGYYFVLSYSWFAVMQPVQMLVLITVGIAAFICACVVHTASYAVWCSSVSSVMLTVKRICVDFFHEVIPYLPPPTKLKFSCCISVPFEYDLFKLLLLFWLLVLLINILVTRLYSLYKCRHKGHYNNNNKDC